MPHISEVQNDRRDRFISDMLVWLNAYVIGPIEPIISETELFRCGLMDSLRVLDLIAYTERAIGSMIPESLIRIDNFETVSRIADVFVSDSGERHGLTG